MPCSADAEVSLILETKLFHDPLKNIKGTAVERWVEPSKLIIVIGNGVIAWSGRRLKLMMCSKPCRRLAHAPRRENNCPVAEINWRLKIEDQRDQHGKLDRREVVHNHSESDFRNAAPNCGGLSSMRRTRCKRPFPLSAQFENQSGFPVRVVRGGER